MDDVFKLMSDEFINSLEVCRACGENKIPCISEEYRGTVPFLILSDLPLKNSEGYVLLDNLIKSLGFKPSDYFISSIIKCADVDLNLDNAKNCRKHLAQEFRMLRPKIIMLLGSGAYEAFYGTKPDGNKVRGVFNKTNGFEIITSCNPNKCLDNLKLKLLLYEDMGNVQKRLNELSLLN